MRDVIQAEEMDAARLLILEEKFYDLLSKQQVEELLEKQA